MNKHEANVFRFDLPKKTTTTMTKKFVDREQKRMFPDQTERKLEKSDHIPVIAGGVPLSHLYMNKLEQDSDAMLLYKCVLLSGAFAAGL